MAGHSELYPRYVKALLSEMQRRQACSATQGSPRPFVGEGEGEGDIGRRPLGRLLNSLYVGGGTPSLLPADIMGEILSCASSGFGLAPDAEVSIEANPHSGDSGKFRLYREAGFNRLSLGVQSLDGPCLKILGRCHTAIEAEQAFRSAREAGFQNVSVDLMFGIPGATREAWQRSVNRVLSWQPEHISAYALTVEAGTPYEADLHAGTLALPSDEESAWAYEWCMQRMEEEGYEHYEVSNFARPGHRCRHNWACWTGGEYLGIGVAAHSFEGTQRRWNTSDLATYLERVEAGMDPGAGSEDIDEGTRQTEEIWLGLRTCEGWKVPAKALTRLEADERFRSMGAEGMIVRHNGRVALTSKGFLLADAVCVTMMEITESRC